MRDSGKMKILEETAALVKEKIGREYERLSIEKAVIGLFFTGVKLSNGMGGYSQGGLLPEFRRPYL